MRLGDLDALKEAVINNFDNLQAYFVKEFIKEIDNAPTVEPPAEWQIEFMKKLFEEVRPLGQWINHKHLNYYGHNIADCSNCGEATQWHDENEGGIPRYCWCCGADMRGEE